MENIKKIIKTIQPYLGCLLTILTAIIVIIPILSKGITFFSILYSVCLSVFFYDTCKLWLNTRKKGE